MTDKIKAVFIGGPADGRRMEINASMREVRVPVSDPQALTGLISSENAAPPIATPTYEVATYIAHLVDLPGYPPLAFCMLANEFNWSAILLTLVDNYRPAGGEL